MTESMPPAEHHTRNLRFRDNPTVFNDSAKWLDTHRDEALPVMGEHLAEGGPPALGIVRVMGKMDDSRTVPALVKALHAGDDRLAFEAARALGHTSGDEAEAALREAAGSDEPQVAANALRGIGIRGDDALCDAVTPRLEDHDPVGYQAREAAKALGCG